MSFTQQSWYHKIICLTDLDFENWPKTSRFGIIGCRQLEYLNEDKNIEVWQLDQK